MLFCSIMIEEGLQLINEVMIFLRDLNGAHYYHIGLSLPSVITSIYSISPAGKEESLSWKLWIWLQDSTPLYRSYWPVHYIFMDIFVKTLSIISPFVISFQFFALWVHYNIMEAQKWFWLIINSKCLHTGASSVKESSKVVRLHKNAQFVMSKPLKSKLKKQTLNLLKSIKIQGNLKLITTRILMHNFQTCQYSKFFKLQIQESCKLLECRYLIIYQLSWIVWTEFFKIYSEDCKIVVVHIVQPPKMK